jgi:hypothetical protein
MTLLVASRVFTWLDLPAAAAYVDVTPAELRRAVEGHQLPLLTDARGETMLRSTDLDLWSLWALGRPTPSARDAELAGVSS